MMKNFKNPKHLTAFLLPEVLLVTTYFIFHFLTSHVGQKTGYFLGFVFYWLFWCFAMPLCLIGIKPIGELFKINQLAFGHHKIRNILCLLLPLVFAYTYEFPKVVIHSNSSIIISSLGLSLVNATAEEILWRGTFLKLMGEHSKKYVLFSSFSFAIWHFVPLSVFGNHHPGGNLSFIIASFLHGLMYSAVSKDTKSIALTSISHFLFDFSGLGTRIYF